MSTVGRNPRLEAPASREGGKLSADVSNLVILSLVSPAADLPGYLDRRARFSQPSRLH